MGTLAKRVELGLLFAKTSDPLLTEARIRVATPCQSAAQQRRRVGLDPLVRAPLLTLTGKLLPDSLDDSKGGGVMAEPVRNYPKLAADIVDLVGGEKNIASAVRCATRLRLVLRDTPAGAKDAVSKLPGVITVVESGGQFQVVIGAHVG